MQGVPLQIPLLLLGRHRCRLLAEVTGVDEQPFFLQNRMGGPIAGNRPLIAKPTVGRTGDVPSLSSRSRPTGRLVVLPHGRNLAVVADQRAADCSRSTATVAPGGRWASDDGSRSRATC